MTTDEMTATERYLAAVRNELDYLPDDERSDVLEDVEQHLLEVSAEAEGPLETLLGPPEQYAADLRAAAGLPPRGADEDDVVAQRLGARIARSWPGRLVRRTAARLDRSPTYRGMRDFLPELRPGWWVLRGYLAVLVLGMLTSDSGKDLLPIPAVIGNHLLGLLALVVAIRASVAWGRRAVSPRLRLATNLASILVVLFALVAVANSQPSAPYYETGSAKHDYYYGGDLSGPNGPVTNIYPYAADGTPLDNVLLYDQDGQPLVVADADRATGNYCEFKGDARFCTSLEDELQRGRPAQLFPRPEPIIDPRTGEVTGEKSRPVVVPPAGITPSATPTASAAPTPTPTTTQSAKPRPTKTR